MIRVSKVIHGWLGWCPNAYALKAPLNGKRTVAEQPGFPEPETPQPGSSPATVTVPSWMTALALIILSATCFVGGNIWWPFFVGVVLIFCLAYWYHYHIREVP